MPKKQRIIPIITLATKLIQHIGPYIDKELPIYTETSESAEQAFVDVIEALQIFSEIIDVIPRDEIYSLLQIIIHFNKIINTISLQVLTTNTSFGAKTGKCETCGDKARYGTPGDKIGKFCVKHKGDTIDIKNKRCQLCYWYRAQKGEAGTNKSVYCVHCTIIMGITDFKTTTISNCGIDGCTKAKTHGIIETNKRLCCGEHGRLKGYVNVHTKKCILCKTTVCKWALKSDDIVQYCGSCVKVHDLDAYCARYQKCELCDTTGHYGTPGESFRYCSKHTKEGMNKMDGLCQHSEMCKTIAKFNYPDKKTGKFCKEHAAEGMINVTSNKCLAEYGIAAVYNFPGETCGIRCISHIEPGMIDINIKLCEKCNIRRAFYGTIGKSSVYCSDCKEACMIYNPNAFCKVVGCRNKACVGNNFMFQHCEIHKVPTDIIYNEGTCILCDKLDIIDSDGLCEACVLKSVEVKVFAKQTTMTKYLLDKGLHPVSIDRTIRPGCRSRPDMLYDRGDISIVVECDEYQHKRYSKIDETNRMIKISQAIGKPTGFIRFNPDSYLSIKSQVHISDRYKVLSDFLQKIMASLDTIPNNSLCCVVYMFYDGWTSLDETSWITITEKIL